jgi:long-chain acyl-CoA synthetase
MLGPDTLARIPLPFGADLARALGRLLRPLAPPWRRSEAAPPEAPPAVEEEELLTRPYPWEASYPPGVTWDIAVPARPLHALLEDAVGRFAERTCVDCLDRRFSYAEIGRLVDRAAKGFQALGVGREVRVGLLLPNSPYFVIAFYAVLKAGGTVVTLNPLYAEAEIREILLDAGVRVVVTVDHAVVYRKLARALEASAVEHVVVARMSRLLPLAQRGLYALLGWRQRASVPRDGRHLPFERLVANDGRPEPVAIDPAREVALLHYTGGIDGEPKAAMLTHTNLHANALQACAWYPNEVEQGERILGVVPLCHAFGLSGVLNVGVLAGATLVLLPRFSVEDTLGAIERKRITLFPGVPSMFAMLASSRRLARYDLSSLRLGVSGGAPLPAAVQSRFEALTAGRLVEGYGLTEAGPVVTCNPVSAGRRADSVGLPLPGTIVEILSIDGRRRRLPPGVPGEVCVRGPQVMAGYWNRPDASAAVLRDGRLHTGDLGYLDEAGFLHLTGRLKRLILVGGYNVYPSRVEAEIRTHPAVAEAAVSGVPDARLGERVRAVVRLRPGAGLTNEQLRVYLKERLSPFEIPRDVTIVPATGIGASDAAPGDAGRDAGADERAAGSPVLTSGDG